MKSLRTREAAFADYLKGHSLREVADRHGLSKRTLERWSAEDRWNIHRQHAWNESKRRITEQYHKDFAERDQLASDKIFNLLIEATSQHQAYLKGEIPKKALRATPRALCSLAWALNGLHVEDRHHKKSTELKIQKEETNEK